MRPPRQEGRGLTEKKGSGAGVRLGEYMRPPRQEGRGLTENKVCEAVSGFRHLNGYADRPPVRPNISLGDSLAGLHAAFGVALALLERLRPDGRGQVIDASITESMFNMLEAATTEYAYSGADREPRRVEHREIREVAVLRRLVAEREISPRPDDEEAEEDQEKQHDDEVAPVEVVEHERLQPANGPDERVGNHEE